MKYIFSVILLINSIFSQDTMKTSQGKELSGKFISENGSFVKFKMTNSSTVSSIPFGSVVHIKNSKGDIIFTGEGGKKLEELQYALILKRELVVNSSVSKQEQQDVLKLKSGGNYKGEYIKIESADVLFKPGGSYGSQRIKIDEIKMLKLSDGTEVIKNGRVKRKENETITIKPGDKIMVEYDKISKSVTGLFHGFDNGEITIQTAHVQGQKPVYTNVPVNSVANIIVLPMKSAGYIPSLTASCGIIMFALSSLDGFDSEVGYVMAGLGAITGALGGFVLNDIALKGSRYTLVGKDAWYIYNQDIK